MKSHVVNNISGLLNKIENYIHILFDGMQHWYDQVSFRLEKTPQRWILVPEVLKSLPQHLNLPDKLISYGKGVSSYKITDGYIIDDHIHETLDYHGDAKLSLFFNISHYTAEQILKYPKDIKRNTYLIIPKPNRRIVNISKLDTTRYDKLKLLSQQSFQDLDRWLAAQSVLSRYLNLVYVFQKSYKDLQNTHVIFSMYKEYPRVSLYRWIAIDPRLSMQDIFFIDGKWHLGSTVIWGWQVEIRIEKIDTP